MARVEDGWHLVGQSEDEGSERSLSRGPGSRPCTPAISLTDHALHELGLLGSECPPTPESERLADTVLCAPFGPGTAEHAAGSQSARPVHNACSSVDACGPEVVSLHCLQGLSQEGPLEGFALQRLPATSPPGAEGEMCSDADEQEEAALDGAERDIDARTGWQGMDSTHLAGMDALVELLEGLGWTGGCVIQACRMGMLGAQQYLACVQQAMAHGASVARQGAESKVSQVMVRMSKVLRPLMAGGTASGVLVASLGMTTLASLAGLIFFMGRARQLGSALHQRDRELARLVIKILNLQEALTQPRMSSPALRHTADVLSGLMAPLMFTSG